jgi:hexokinase
VSPGLSRQITAEMLLQMEQGLAGDTRSTMLMLPSWLPSLPTGNETGSAFAIDFGGTSFRVMEVVLGNGPNEVV